MCVLARRRRHATPRRARATGFRRPTHTHNPHTQPTHTTHTHAPKKNRARKKELGAWPGFEPGTSPTLRENHTPRPPGRLGVHAAAPARVARAPPPPGVRALRAFWLFVVCAARVAVPVNKKAAKNYTNPYNTHKQTQTVSLFVPWRCCCSFSLLGTRLGSASHNTRAHTHTHTHTAKPANQATTKKKKSPPQTTNKHTGARAPKKCSDTGTRTRVSRVRAEDANHLHHVGEYMPAWHRSLFDPPISSLSLSPK